MKLKMSKISPEKKYDDVITSIKILSRRAFNENKQDVRVKLENLITYLQRVREQRHLAMMSEHDRIERVRYKELLDYIDREYDENKSNIKEICRTISKREDMDIVLGTYKKEEIER